MDPFGDVSPCKSIINGILYSTTTQHVVRTPVSFWRFSTPLALWPDLLPTPLKLASFSESLLLDVQLDYWLDGEEQHSVKFVLLRRLHVNFISEDSQSTGSPRSLVFHQKLRASSVSLGSRGASMLGFHVAGLCPAANFLYLYLYSPFHTR